MIKKTIAENRKLESDSWRTMTSVKKLPDLLNYLFNCFAAFFNQLIQSHIYMYMYMYMYMTLVNS